MINSEPESPTLKRTRGISPVWILPIIALVIAGVLAWQAWLEQGPSIEITFADASGVKPGKTLIRYKDVDVGVVKDVKLTESLNKVRVFAELVPDIADHLSADTRFWVVSPRIALSGVSGLNTLLSGVYIEMDPGKPGRFQGTFEGLDVAPAVRSDEKGSRFHLVADELGSIDVGSPIYHRQIKVGEITSYKLSQSEKRIHINVFVEAPYDSLVLKSSRFWNVSGVGFEFGANGLEAHIESLNTLIAGGIAFDSPEFGADLRAAGEDDKFYLFENYKAVNEGSFLKNYYYALKFNESVRGLNSGASVEYNGIRIGEVAKIEFGFAESGETKITVLIALQPERLERDSDMTKTEMDTRLQTMIANGLKARLKSSSLITGGLFVDLTYTGDARGELVIKEHFHEIPTVAGEYAQLTRQAADIVHKVNQIPFEQIGRDMAISLEKLNTTLTTLQNARVAEKLGNSLGNLETASVQLDRLVASAIESLEQLTLSLGTLEEGLAPDSQLYNEMLDMMDRVGDAADSLEELTDELNRYPQSLILGNETRSE